MRRSTDINAPRQRARQIYETLRERICLLDYKPGEILKERELASEFGVSRTPLRRVLQWLERDGLILSRQGHGTVVTAIDLENLRETYALRTKLAELIGAFEPVAPTPEVLEALAELDRLCHKAAAGKPNYRLFARINIGLHRLYQSVIGNKPLRDVSDQLFYQTARMWFQLLRRADWQEEIADLQQEIHAVERHLREGDVESAGFVRRNQLAKVLRRLEALS